MSTSDQTEPDSAPLSGSPIVVGASPQAAQIRDGERAPAHDLPTVPTPDNDCWTALWAMKDIFDIDPRPSQNPGYHLLVPKVRRLDRALVAQLMASLRDLGQDEVTAQVEQVLEIRNMLPHYREHN